jgi:hypothetical protein
MQADFNVYTQLPPAGLITRSVLKALATEGVTTPHHARRFLLQQCRAVADEVTSTCIPTACVCGITN